MKKEKESDKKTLFVRMQSGSLKRIHLPDGCKVTFGPLCPGTKGSNNGGGSPALRIYHKATQVACFVQVESFYEIGTIQCIEKSTKRATKVQQFEEDGISKQRSVAVEVSEWRDELIEEVESDSAGVFKALKDEHKD